MKRQIPPVAGLALSLALGSGLAAQAQDYDSGIVRPTLTAVDQFSVTTVTGISSTFNRAGIQLGQVTTPPFGLSGSGTDVAYGVNTYVPASDGTYVVANSTSDYGTSTSGTSNFAQFLYTPSFTPTSAGAPPAATDSTTNLQLADNPVGNSDAYAADLSANTANIFVNSGRYNATAANDANPTKKSTGTSTTTIYQYNAGSTQNIPANNAGEVTFTANVANSTLINSFDSITLYGLQASAVGGLVCTLTHGDIQVILFDKTGADNNPNDPNYDLGSGSTASFGQPGIAHFTGIGTTAGPTQSSDLFAGQDYTFAENGADLSATPQPGVGNAGSTYAPSNVVYKATPNPYGSGFFSSFNQNALSAFNGQDAQGAWYLDIADVQPGDTASLQGFSFGLNGAPEPSQFASLGLGGLALGGLAVRARRRLTRHTA